jgi:hypothetical protein
MKRISPTKFTRNSPYWYLYNLWFGREFLQNKEEEFLLSKYDNEVHLLSLRNEVIQNTNLFFEKGRFDDFLELDIFQEYYFEYLTFSRNINIASASHQFRPSNFLADLYVLYIQTGLIDEYLTEGCSKKYLVSLRTPAAACDYFRLWFCYDLRAIEDYELSLEVELAECELGCEWEEDDLPVAPFFDEVEANDRGWKSRVIVGIHFEGMRVVVFLWLFFVEVDLSILAEGKHEGAIFDEDSIWLNIMVVTIGLECFDWIIWDLLVFWEESINRFIFNNDGSNIIANLKRIMFLISFDLLMSLLMFYRLLWLSDPWMLQYYKMNKINHTVSLFNIPTSYLEIYFSSTQE